MPLLNDRITKQKFNYVVEKVQARLTGWKAKTLSLAGRCTLINLVLAGIPSYVMQTVWLPQATCDALNKLNRNFLWGSTVDKRKVHQVRWEQVTKNKKHGGLGIRDTRKANMAHLAKLGSKIACGSGSIWAQVLRKKYLKNEGMFEHTVRPGHSPIWKGIRRSFNRIENGFAWNVGNGRIVSLWFDVWVGETPLCLLVGLFLRNNGIGRWRIF